MVPILEQLPPVGEENGEVISERFSAAEPKASRDTDWAGEIGHYVKGLMQMFTSKSATASREIGAQRYRHLRAVHLHTAS